MSEKVVFRDLPKWKQDMHLLRIRGKQSTPMQCHLTAVGITTDVLKNVTHNPETCEFCKNYYETNQNDQRPIN